MPYLCLIGAALFSRRLEPGGRPLRIASTTAVGALLAVTLWNIGSAWAKREQFKPGEITFIQWLREQPQKGAVFDFMQYRDGRYIVYASHLGTLAPYWGQGSSNPFALRVRRPPHAGGELEMQTVKKHMLAHATLLQRKCDYLVLTRDEYFKGEVSQHPPKNLSEMSSYFRDDIQPASPDGSLIHFQSSVLPRGSECTLRRVYEDSLVDVFEKVDNGERAQNTPPPLDGARSDR
jgi:hypothetical protein